MSRLMLALLCSCMTIAALSQQQRSDSLRQLLSATTGDTARSMLQLKLANLYVQTNTDSSLHYAYQALKLAEKTNHAPARINSRRILGMVIGFSGNYVKALQYLLDAKAIAEEAASLRDLGSLHHILGNLYRWQKDYNQSTIQYRIALDYQEREKPKANPYLTESNLSEVYLERNILDSALMFAQRAYENLLVSPSKSSAYALLSRLGRIHQALGNESLGRNFLKMAEEKVMPTQETRNKCFYLLDLSSFFQKAGQVDSSIYYTKRILTLPGSQAFKPQLLDATQLLAQLYTGRNTDSAFKYLNLSLALKEELLGAEQQQQMQTIRYEEELRQQQAAARKAREEEDRKHNLQYAAIAVFMISFVVLFILFSHSIIANQRLIRFLGILSLLIVFEFLNLLLHPYLGSITHHQPLYMLGAMVCIAALLIPLHHKLEHWITHKMIEKNNRIRLAAAKKTIAQLEGKVSQVEVEKSANTQNGE